MYRFIKVARTHPVINLLIDKHPTHFILVSKELSVGNKQGYKQKYNGSQIESYDPHLSVWESKRIREILSYENRDVFIEENILELYNKRLFKIFYG